MQTHTSSGLLASHGRGLDALAQSKGGTATMVAAALNGAARSLRPRDLCDAYRSGLDGKSLDSPRLLTLARAALEALNGASRLGAREAVTFLTSALHSGLFALVFRDARSEEFAAAQHLCDETVASFELACRRAAQTVTRPVKPGAMVRTTFTGRDGQPLHSFVLFREDDGQLLEDFVSTFAADPCPCSAFGLYAESRIPPGEAATEDAVALAQLGERFIAAASEAYLAQITVMTHTIGLGILPAPYVSRMTAIASTIELSTREFEGLFLTFGKHQVGIAALTMIAVFAASGPAFVRMLDPQVDGLARIMAALSNPSLGEPSLNGCLTVVSYVCGHSERFAQALVDKGAFKVLQPVIRHDNVVLAVRAAYTVASIAVSCNAAAEPLRWSGALEVMASVLHANSLGSAIMPGFFIFAAPSVFKLLRPGVEPTLQLAALHRLGAALIGTTSIAEAVTTTPLVAALRGCATSRDSFVQAAAKYVLKELQQPLHAPPTHSVSSSDLNSTLKKLAEGEDPSKVELYSLGLRLVASEMALSDTGSAASSAAVAVTKQVAVDAGAGEGAGAGARAGAGAEAAGAEEHEEITREMLAGLLGRPSAALDAAWRLFMSDKISEDQLMRTFASELAAGAAGAPGAEESKGFEGARQPAASGSGSPTRQAEAAPLSAPLSHKASPANAPSGGGSAK